MATMINKLTRSALNFFDTSYVLKFIFRLLALYVLFRLINWLMIGAIVPGGFYSPFIDNYLNYITVIKISVLQMGSWLGQLLGVDSFLLNPSYLQIVGSKKLFMAWACCGLEIMSFWAAFALADTTALRTKLLWCFGGLFCIWLINCIRVAILTVAIKNKWPIIGSYSHHDTFNIVAYGLVFVLMLAYYRKNKMQLGI